VGLLQRTIPADIKCGLRMCSVGFAEQVDIMRGCFTRIEIGMTYKQNRPDAHACARMDKRL